jgi:hypothetical protein
MSSSKTCQARPLTVSVRLVAWLCVGRGGVVGGGLSAGVLCSIRRAVGAPAVSFALCVWRAMLVVLTCVCVYVCVCECVCVCARASARHARRGARHCHTLARTSSLVLAALHAIHGAERTSRACGLTAYSKNPTPHHTPHPKPCTLHAISCALRPCECSHCAGSVHTIARYSADSLKSMSWCGSTQVCRH